MPDAHRCFQGASKALRSWAFASLLKSWEQWGWLRISTDNDPMFNAVIILRNPIWYLIHLDTFFVSTCLMAPVGLETLQQLLVGMACTLSEILLVKFTARIPQPWWSKSYTKPFYNRTQWEHQQNINRTKSNAKAGFLDILNVYTVYQNNQDTKIHKNDINWII